jgi:hypothetical protein
MLAAFHLVRDASCAGREAPDRDKRPLQLLRRPPEPSCLDIGVGGVL